MTFINRPVDLCHRHTLLFERLFIPNIKCSFVAGNILLMKDDKIYADINNFILCKSASNLALRAGSERDYAKGG
jgi:hypothetical protein